MSEDERERAEYTAWLDRLDGGDTPTLEEYRRWVAYDDNLPWRLPVGQVVSLLEVAIDDLDTQAERTQWYSTEADSLRTQRDRALGEVAELAVKIHGVRQVLARIRNPWTRAHLREALARTARRR